MDSRLTELEIKVAFQDSLLDELNHIVTQQQRQIDQMQHHLQQLLEHVLANPQASENSAKHEIPPHY